MRLLREPLFHFVLFGFGIFAWYSWLNPVDPNAQSADQIIVDTLDLERLSQQFQATWRRPPSETELRGLVASLVREEVLVREAKALGLDRGDGVVRNRLSQKMDFLTTSVAQAMEPADDELKSYFQQNGGDFAIPATVAFEQVAVSPDEDVEAIIQALNSGADPGAFSGPSLLPAEVPLSSAPTVDGVFGRNFSAAMNDLPVGEWVGPVESGYGTHIVRISRRTPEAVPPLADVRDRVLADWRRAKSEELKNAQLDFLRAQYEIVTPDPAAYAEWTLE